MRCTRKNSSSGRGEGPRARDANKLYQLMKLCAASKVRKRQSFLVQGALVFHACHDRVQIFTQARREHYRQFFDIGIPAKTKPQLLTDLVGGKHTELKMVLRWIDGVVKAVCVSGMRLIRPWDATTWPLLPSAFPDQKA